MGDDAPGAGRGRQGHGTGRTERRFGKRSQTVSLVLVAGAGLAALGLGRSAPERQEEDVLVYADAWACAVARLRTEAACDDAQARARALYPDGAPRYPTRAGCERHHGTDHCLPGESVTEDARGTFVPRMAAFFLARTAGQDVEPEPVYEHRPEQDGAGEAGYCRGSGGRVVTGHGGHAALARIVSPARRGVAFGGFGRTGRAYTASSRGVFGGG